MMEAPPRRAKRRRTAVPSGSPRPVVSVIVPAHNAAEWLPDCLASIASQTFPHGALEVCLCDDASTDRGHAQWSHIGPQSCAVQGYASFSRRQRGLGKTMQSKPTRAAALRLWDRPKGSPRHRPRLHKRLKQASPRRRMLPPLLPPPLQ